VDTFGVLRQANRQQFRVRIESDKNILGIIVEFHPVASRMGLDFVQKCESPGVFGYCKLSRAVTFMGLATFPNSAVNEDYYGYVVGGR
jgi:hypothetical protein